METDNKISEVYVKTSMKKGENYEDMSIVDILERMRYLSEQILGTR